LQEIAALRNPNLPSKTELETWMKAKDWSASQTAAFLHVNVRTVQRWLSGDRQIPDWLETVMAVRRK
jgi:transcriptional regulator with XRE-family HTH domain